MRWWLVGLPWGVQMPEIGGCSCRRDGDAQVCLSVLGVAGVGRERLGAERGSSVSRAVNNSRLAVLHGDREIRAIKQSCSGRPSQGTESGRAHAIHRTSRRQVMEGWRGLEDVRSMLAEAAPIRPTYPSSGRNAGAVAGSSSWGRQRVAPLGLLSAGPVTGWPIAAKPALAASAPMMQGPISSSPRALPAAAGLHLSVAG